MLLRYVGTITWKLEIWMRNKTLPDFEKNWLTGLSRRLKKALARYHRKKWKMRCLRRFTSRFCIIGFNYWRSRIRKIITIFWRNWDGRFRSCRNHRPQEFWETNRTLSSWICETTRLKQELKLSVFRTIASLEFWCGNTKTKNRNRHRNSRFNVNWWNMRLCYIAVELPALHSKTEYQVSLTRFYLCLYPLESFLNNFWCIQCSKFSLELFFCFFKIKCVCLELVYFHSNSYQQNLIRFLNWFDCLAIENLLYLYLKYIWP